MFTTINSGNYNTWIKTNDGQWVYRQDLGQFWVSQIRLWEDNYCVTLNLIDIDSYDEKYIKETMYAYGYEQDISEINAQIIVECLAEELDNFQVIFKGTYQECEHWIEDTIKNWGKDI